MANDQPLSQDDIDKLISNLEASGLSGGPAASTKGGDLPAPPPSDGVELDTIGELLNISFGSASTTLGMTLNVDVQMSTPDIQIHDALDGMLEPFPDQGKLMALAQFTHYSMVLILKTAEAKLLAELMLGNPVGELDDSPLSDLQMGGVSEALNQMLNAAATSLSSLMNEEIEVSNPEVIFYDIETLKAAVPELAEGKVSASAFELTLGQPEHQLHLVQLMCLKDLQSQIDTLMSLAPEESVGVPDKKEADVADVSTVGVATAAGAAAHPGAGAPQGPPPGYGGQPGGYPPPYPPEYGGYPPPGYPYPPQGYQTPPYPPHGHPGHPTSPVTVHPVQFSPFDSQIPIYGEHNKNLDLVMDVTLNLTVELGRTDITIKEILELTRGSVIELDRIAGEPVDLLANGKLIAKGEVVVIEDNFGLRITSIVSPAERLRGL